MKLFKELYDQLETIDNSIKSLNSKVCENEKSQYEIQELLLSLKDSTDNAIISLKNKTSLLETEAAEINSKITVFNDRITNSIDKYKDLNESIQNLNFVNELRDQRMASDDLTVQTCINDIVNLRQQLSEIASDRDQGNEKIDILFKDTQTLKETNDKRDRRMASDDLTTQTCINDIVSLRQQINDIVDELSDLGVVIGKNKEFNMLNKTTNSQAGEDAILAYIFAVLKIPFGQCNYLDLGANHAKEMSNTYFFYSQGARGVLVEANTDLIPELKFYRNEDIIINKCISETTGNIVDFSVFNVDGLSTSNIDSSMNMKEINPSLEVKELRQVETICVMDILDKYFDSSPKILNIDIEGMEIEVLKTIDFNKYRPLTIIVEMIPYSTKLLVGVKNKEICSYMDEIGYTEFAFTGINSIFIDKQYKK